MSTIPEMLSQAYRHHQAGNFQQAEQCYRQLLQKTPRHIDALHMLGLLAHQTGRNDVAHEYIGKAVRLKPNFAEAHSNLGNVLAQLGRLDEAVASWRRALRLKPGIPEVHSNLGLALLEQGKLDEATASLQQALRLRPNYPDAHNNLGNVFKKQGKFAEALACYQQALQLQPGYAQAHVNVGATLHEQGRLEEAVACYHRALIIDPNYVEAHCNLGLSLKELGKLDQALATLQRAVQLQPTYAEAHMNLGLVLHEQRHPDRAAVCHQQALRLRPNYAEAHNHLANALKEQGQLSQAMAGFRQAVSLKPDFADAHNNLGNALKEQGKLDEALSCYREALRLKPDFAIAHDNLLFTMQYCPGITLAELAAAHAEYERRQVACLRAAWKPHANDRDPDRKLRLGLVSPDFGVHPVGYFLIGGLENLDRGRMEIVGYSDRAIADDMTRRFQAVASIWRNVIGMRDEQLAEQIRADRIDILVDLAGHTARNRLPMFARKPAPIQLTWAGYVGTTGLTAIDYLVADRFYVPPESERHYCERILRLPDAYVGYDPPSFAPPVQSLPALTSGQVTFGSFNNPAKITPEVVRVWARILRRVPRSRLLIKYRGMSDALVAGRFNEMFTAEGIEPGRLELSDFSPHAELLGFYNRIDIALDPFPYSGGLTTCEALWMGVPVMTCPGETFASRHSFSYLSVIGLTETICRSLPEYEDRAAALAGDLPRLAELRRGLRARMAGSPLCDGARFARNLLAALRGVWRHYCADAPYRQGNALQQQGKLTEAMVHWQQAVRIAPDHAEAHNNLGIAFQEQGQLDEAVVSLQHALRLKPDFIEAHHNLGNALLAQRQLEAAIDQYRYVLQFRPNSVAAYNNLGKAFLDQDKLDEAVASLREALKIEPEFVEAHNNLGLVKSKQGQNDEAVACFRRALQLNPDSIEAHNHLGNACKQQGNLEQAVDCYRRALRLAPDRADVHVSLGIALSMQGRLDEALACFRQSLRLKPDDTVAHDNLVYTMQYRSGITLAELAEVHAEYERRQTAPLRAVWKPHGNGRDPERRLRLGLVSADFFAHPVGYFLIRVLENLDQGEAEVVCYSNRPTPDAMTGRFRAAATLWRDVVGLSDAQLAERIRADDIDILFDLAGHTAGNRLLVFARKPAPIQISWAGYVGTTGLAAMDYVLADRFQVPPEAEPHYCERILRLPHAYVCYDPPKYAPPVGPLPALAAGRVTFGSFNNQAKLAPEVIRLWAAILRRLPESRVMLKYRGMSDRSVAGRLTEMFAGEGIEPGRLEFLGLSDHTDLLEHYNRVDIGLDPFPYSGGLTTCEALWMGVPVITCPGETFAARHALTHLSNVGLTETIAPDFRTYVELAVALANDLPRLAALRAGLRERMAASPLCDGRLFAENLSALLRECWRQYCAGA